MSKPCGRISPGILRCGCETRKPSPPSPKTSWRTSPRPTRSYNSRSRRNREPERDKDSRIPGTKVTNPSGHLRAKDDGTEQRMALRGNPGVVLPLRQRCRHGHRPPRLGPRQPCPIGQQYQHRYDTDSDLPLNPTPTFTPTPPWQHKGKETRATKGAGRKAKEAREARNRDSTAQSSQTLEPTIEENTNLIG